MSYLKKIQFIWLTGLEVTATGNFDNLQTERQRERERGTLPYTDSDQLTAGPSEKVSHTSILVANWAKKRKQ